VRVVNTYKKMLKMQILRFQSVDVSLCKNSFLRTNMSRLNAGMPKLLSRRIVSLINSVIIRKIDMKIRSEASEGKFKLH
jgi:hypothetical protein